MARSERSKKILFEPGRYRMDPAVLAMSDAARGMYSMLFCAACDTHEPGVIEPATPAVLAALAATSPEEWSVHGCDVERAFDTSVPGRWVQRGLVETFAKQDQYIETQRERGRKSARKRSVRRKLNQASTGRAEPVDVPLQPEHETARSPVATPSVLGSRFSDHEKKDPPSVGTDEPRARGPATVSPPASDPAPVQASAPETGELRSFAARNGTHHDPDAVHRLVATGMSSTEAEQLLERESAARERIGGAS